MVAIQITEDGVEVDALAAISVHPAAELFPLMHGHEFAELVADIAEHGQRDAIVMTPDGQLLDGRNRWRACAKAGITPVMRTESSEPWSYVISTNVHRRHLNESQRAMIGARMASRKSGFQGHQSNVSIDTAGPPPTRDEAAALLNIGSASISRARKVLREGIPEVIDLVQDGVVSVYPADRVVTQLTPEQQSEFARRVRNGADPAKLAPPPPASDQGGRPTARTDNRSSKRHQHIGLAALRNLRDSLDALDLVLRSTPDGLDPSITSGEAAQWLGDLSKGRRSLGRVLNLLNERKEITP